LVHMVLAPVLLVVFFVIAIAGIIVVAILAVIYNSPLAIFFPLPDTGYDNPRTVLSEYYRDFNSQIASLEEKGYVVTYQNSEDGVPVSNFNDTLMVYIVKYGTGQAAYVMDDEGKKHLKEVFDEMNYYDSSSSAAQIPAGASLGEVVTTGYCNCSLCCGKWAGGHTASGTVPKADHTLAVDAHSPKVPMGTKIVMNGKIYKVEDTGNFAQYGTDFDIYFDNHAAALAWGKRKVEAFLAEGNENTVEVVVSGTLVHNPAFVHIPSARCQTHTGISALPDGRPISSLPPSVLPLKLHPDKSGGPYILRPYAAPPICFPPLPGGRKRP